MDKLTAFAVRPGDYSVDSMTIIVRNPGSRFGDREHVDGGCRTEAACSVGYLCGRNVVAPVIHNAAVLTGTTAFLEFS